jgi:hypothetical protein
MNVLHDGRADATKESRVRMRIHLSLCLHPTANPTPGTMVDKKGSIKEGGKKGVDICGEALVCLLGS